MAPVYADHPYPLIATPTGKLPSGTKPDMFDDIASEMACVHNMMIRGINSIYLQAPYIKAADELAFANYALQWYRLLHTHHTGEETTFFPAVEAMAGEPGLMEGNVEQHHAFEKGLETFRSYFDEVANKKQKYNGAKVVEIIDAFGKILVEHLTDEIPSLLGLRKYGTEKMGAIMKAMEHEAEHNMKALGLVTGLPFCFMNLDVNFEDGLWKDWPPAPAVVHFLIRYVTVWIHRDWWKFGSTDRKGNMKPLYAVPAEKST